MKDIMEAVGVRGANKEFKEIWMGSHTTDEKDSDAISLDSE